VPDQEHNYGADDRPACPSCGKDMHIIRRSPHPEHLGKYEVQTLFCSSCGHEETRSVDKSGQPPEKNLK
jgi:C4-type Zn-finger protein